MLVHVAIAQAAVFALFLVLERAYPARSLPRAKHFALWFCALNTFSLVWLRILLWSWAALPSGPVSMGGSTLHQGLAFYLAYSFANYWIHRFKHGSPHLWRFIHRFHHSPSRMESMVAFFKHPLEIAFNTAPLVLLGWLASVPVESVALALGIEGCLEVFHHSNTTTHRRLRWMGYVIQTPEMHLVHHQYGLHRFNYAAFLWDSVFGTARIPNEWSGKQGFRTSSDIKSHFFFQAHGPATSSQRQAPRRALETNVRCFDASTEASERRDSHDERLRRQDLETVRRARALRHE